MNLGSGLILKSLFLAALSSALVSASAGANQKESYKDLISKSQNLSLQHDRLQACQILIRAMQKENKNSSAYRELATSLDELSSVFYTDQAQSTFAQGEALVELKPKDAIDKFQEALKLEEGNMAIVKSLTRAQLRIDDCRSADTNIKSAENFDPVSAEYHLLKLQAFQCHRDFEALNEELAKKDVEYDGAEKFMKVFSVDESFQKKDFKKAKQQLANWETQAPDYPEVYYWKWQISNAQGIPDRSSGQKYIQLCKAMTARKRKSFNLDVDLCKYTEDVETKLKTFKL